MVEWVPVILSVLGLALLGVEWWATRSNRRTSQSLRRRKRLFLATCTSVTGALLAYGSFYPEYRLRSGQRVVGVPFMTVVLQLERGRWIDYTGILTLPAIVGNMLVAFLLPQLFVATARWIRRR
jgi:hypothetical protein